MYLSIESADNKILKSMRKGITVEQIEKAMKLVSMAGIIVAGNFIFGDIEETLETAKNTLDFWERYKEYNISLTFISVYPGTHLYRYALQNGIIKDPVKSLKDDYPNINVSKLSDDDMSYVVKRMFNLSANHTIAPEDLIAISTKNCKIGKVSLNRKCLNAEKITREKTLSFS